MSIRTLAAALVLSGGLALPAAAQSDSVPRPAPASPAAAPPLTVQPPPVRRPRRNPDLISREEIAGETARNAYELVRKLRSAWLRPRTSMASEADSPIHVYLDGQLMGIQDELIRIDAATIGEIRYVNGHDAVTRWGRDYTGGAILVVSR
jgi:hypothetical protein